MQNLSQIKKMELAERLPLSQSNFKNIDPKTVHQLIVLCLDNDGENPHTEKLIHFVAERLLCEGKQVWVAKPEEMGQDFNDVLKAGGNAAVQTHIEQARRYVDYRDQRVTGMTLKSEVLNTSNQIESIIPIKPSIIEQFIQNEKNINTVLSPDLDRSAYSLQKLAHREDRADEWVPTSSSVTQQDIEHYFRLCEAEQKKSERNHLNRPPSLVTPKHPALEKMQHKDLER